MIIWQVTTKLLFSLNEESVSAIQVFYDCDSLAIFFFMYAASERTSKGTINVWDFSFTQASGLSTYIWYRWIQKAIYRKLSNSEHNDICSCSFFLTCLKKNYCFLCCAALETLVEIANARSSILKSYEALHRDMKSTKERQLIGGLTVQNKIIEGTAFMCWEQNLMLNTLA